MKKLAANGTTSQDTHRSVARYYRLHSKIYDTTRWSFLFGRSALIQRIASDAEPMAILEVGCGTGTNLNQLAHVFPRAEIHGLDLSKHMLCQAKKKLSRHGDRVRFLQRAYGEPVHSYRPYDLVLFSYSLSMFNPGWEKALDNAWRDLADGGLVSVVDFHDTPLGLFARWMEANHVRLGGHLLDGLRGRFAPHFEKIENAWFGTWSYFQFIGKKEPTE